MTTYNLNLAPTYLADWDNWSVAREIICNALDADPHNCKIQSAGLHRLVVETSTRPNLAEMLVIGQGTKSFDSEDIGQFGEGLKMAALVATRSNQTIGKGPAVILYDGKSVVTFEFQSVLNVSTLHAKVQPLTDCKQEIRDLIEGYVTQPDGFLVIVNMYGIGDCFEGKILLKASEGPIRKGSHVELEDAVIDPMGPTSVPDAIIYCKGVYVATIASMSLYHWNLNDMKINRDRSMVSTASVSDGIGKWLIENHRFDVVKEILENSKTLDSLEMLAIYRSSWMPTMKAMVSEAFYSLYGSNAVLAADDHTTNRKAAEKGAKVVTVLNAQAKHAYTLAGVNLAADMLHKRDFLEAVDPTPYKELINWLRKIDKHLPTKSFGLSLRIFTGESAEFGYADKSENVVWINERLFQQHDHLQLMATYIHECAHFSSDATDCTRAFEAELDTIAAMLAIDILGRPGEKNDA